MSSETLTFAPSPHIHTSRTVRGTMLHVLVALLPAVACSIYYFRLPALWVLAVSVAVCVATEYAVTRWMLRRPSTVGDFSAAVTGVLLALNLPSGLPLWMVAADAFVAIGIAKMAFGGLGCNIFNPALVGRVFLLISFPVAMTTWPLPGAEGVDGATGATILGLLKGGAISPADVSLADAALGNMGGSMGEVSAAALLIGFVYLLAVKVIRYEIPLCIVAAVIAVDWLIGFPWEVDILTGGLLLGAIFMATDYTTSPMTRGGQILYALLIGVIAVSIRRWGSYPEGISFAILIMNGATPLINRYIKPRRFSPRAKRQAAQ